MIEKQKEIRAIAGQWDPNLDAVRIENGLVRGLKCGVFQPDLVNGDVYYKVIGASFIDEEAAAGRHMITVDVVDEHYNRVQGAKVWHGWPVERFPEFDERVQLTIFGSQLAEWGLYANFDAWRVPGPYWVQVSDGKSQTFWGAALPWNHHVCFAVVFQRTTYQTQIPGTLEEVLKHEAQARQLIQFNPMAALQMRADADGFTINSPEFDLTFGGIIYRAQRAEHQASGVARCYYCEVGHYDVVRFIEW